MCNNVLANKITKKGEKKLDYSIESEIFYHRPIISRNIVSKSLRYLREDKIEYRKGHPLKLGDKSRVYEISTVVVDEDKREFTIVYCPNGKTKKDVTSIIRFRNDTVEDVEKFLLHAFSVYELRNIDLTYMHK